MDRCGARNRRGDIKSSAGSGSGAGGSGDGSAQLGEEYWLDIWAFGTSTYGLALSESRLWSLTPREYHRLKRVWEDGQKRQQGILAALQATICNAAWFRPQEGQRPLTVADFLPESAEPVQSVEDKKLILRMMLTAAGSRFKKTKAG